MAIAILGGGILGCCAALELADRGFEATVFERNATLVSEASLYNEGKLHLGFVYAVDATFRTAERMIRGAVQFMDILARWIPSETLRLLPARPFDYVVHRETMISVPQIEHHFARVAEAVQALAVPASAFLPFDSLRAPYRRMSAAEVAARYDHSRVLASFETFETAVDTWTIATALRRAVASHPSIEIRPSTRVVKALDRTDGRFDVSCVGESDERVGPFDAVVNALWTNRRAIDQRYGVVGSGASYTRHKLGVNFLPRHVPEAVPSFTIMLGPFGDVVVYQSGRVYLSWYPDCMIGTAMGSEEIDWSAVLAGVDVDDVCRRSVKAMAAVCPALDLFRAVEPAAVLVNGGSIFALGESDIDDPVSRLHERVDSGPEGRDRYLSVDTAKFTLAPATAVAVANRISTMLGTRGRA